MTSPLPAQIKSTPGSPASVRVGTVVALSPLTVSVQGTVFKDVGWLGSYIPIPGDSVILIGQSSEAGSDPASWVALGASAQVSNSQFRMTQLRRNAAQAISNNTFTPISWDGLLFDNMNGFPAGSSTAFLTPFDGVYEFTGHCSFVLNAAGQRQSLWFLNGTSTESFVSMNATAASVGTRWTMHPMYISLTAGDLMEQLQWHNSGAVTLATETAAGLRPTMTVRYLGVAS